MNYLLRRFMNNKKSKFKRSLPIGQTLETNDLYLPYKKNKKPANKSRPVIIADKQVSPKGIEEYSVIVGSTQETRNTFKYGKYGIKHIRNNLEIEDDEKMPITLNHKFKLTKNCSRIPEEETKQLYDRVVEHTRFASENIKKKIKFDNRYKKR